jgi:hypothetical protein
MQMQPMQSGQQAQHNADPMGITPGSAEPGGANPASALPNATAMAGASAGAAGGANTMAPTAMAKPAPIATPQAPTSLTSAPQPIGTNGVDPIAELGKAADYGTNQQIIHQRQLLAQQAQQANNNQYSGISNSNGPLPSVNGFNPTQLQNAQAIINIGKQRGMSRDDIQTALMTALTESSLNNINGGDMDSLGLFQQRPSQGWGTAQQIMDPSYAANKFYDSLSAVQNRGQLTPWQAAQAVQRSAFDDGSNYQRQFGNAQRLMGSLFDQQAQNQGAMVSPTIKPNGSLQWIDNHANKYLDYDGQYGAQCVDLYAFYTTGFVGGQAPPVGYAQEIWNNYDRNAYLQVNRSQLPQMGDVAVWGAYGSTPMSHVAIILQDNGDGTVRTLSNNATSAGPNGNSAVVNISKGSLLGYLRPRKLMGV